MTIEDAIDGFQCLESRILCQHEHISVGIQERIQKIMALSFCVVWGFVLEALLQSLAVYLSETVVKGLLYTHQPLLCTTKKSDKIFSKLLHLRICDFFLSQNVVPSYSESLLSIRTFLSIYGHDAFFHPVVLSIMNVELFFFIIVLTAKRIFWCLIVMQ